LAALLRHEEIPQGWADFKDRWYKTAAELESLKDIRSGLGEDFLKAVRDIMGETSGIAGDAGRLIASVQRIAPGRAQELKSLEEEVVSPLHEVSKDIGDIIARIEEYREISGQGSKIKKNLEEAEKAFSEQEKMAKKTCARLEEARKGYQAKLQNIKNATKIKLVNFRKGFVSELEPVFDGYDIVGNAPMDVGALFDALVEDPSYHQKVTVVSKGFALGKKKSDAAVRGLLLGYKAQEVIDRIKPVLEEERRRIEKYAAEGEEIENLEIQCQELRDEAERLKVRVESFREELAANQARAGEIEKKLSSYDQVLSIRDRLLNKFNQSGGAVKSLGTLIEEAVEGYEPVERDVEKRELKAELRAVTGERDALARAKKELESRVEALSGEVERHAKELERLSASMESHREEKERLTSENTTLRTELERAVTDLEKALDRAAELEKDNAKLKKEAESALAQLEKATERYKEAERELEKYRQALQDKEKEYEELEARYKESSAELDDLRAEIQRLDEEMLARIRALESDIKRQTSGMLKTRGGKKRAMTKEEKKVEKKLTALREKKA